MGGDFAPLENPTGAWSADQTARRGMPAILEAADIILNTAFGVAAQPSIIAILRLLSGKVPIVGGFAVFKRTRYPRSTESRNSTSANRA
jgi:hypothetical protein